MDCLSFMCLVPKKYSSFFASYYMLGCSLMIIKCHIWICYHLLAACAILFWLRRLSGGHMFHLNFFSSILAGFLTEKPSRRSQNWTYFIAFKKISKLKLFDRIYKDSMWLIHYVGKGLFDLHTHVFPFEVKSGYK